MESGEPRGAGARQQAVVGRFFGTEKLWKSRTAEEIEEKKRAGAEAIEFAREV